MKKLPALAQIAPVFGILTEDINGDGNLDIVLSGNFYGPDVEAWRYDAGYGLVLLGNGMGDFETIDKLQSGIDIHGDMRGMISIPYAGNTNILLCAAVNNGNLHTFLFNNKLPLNILTFKPDSRCATIELVNGKKRKQEVYYGAGYLSQSANYIIKNKNIKSVLFHTAK